MRNLFLSLVLIGLTIGCNQKTNKENKATKKQVEVIIPDSLLGKDWEGNEILVGKISYAQMVQYTKTWFSAEYDRYRVNAAQLAQIQPLLEDKKVVLIMGTWCEDSQREVPGMMKILTEAAYPVDRMEIIAVDEDKQTVDGIEKTYNLAYVPALIFFDGDKEINRIVEFPITTLEKDMLEILSREDYKNAYAE